MVSFVTRPGWQLQALNEGSQVAGWNVSTFRVEVSEKLMSLPFDATLSLKFGLL